MIFFRVFVGLCGCIVFRVYDPVYVLCAGVGLLDVQFFFSGCI